MGERAASRAAPLKDLWVSTKCGESDHDFGCGANPTVGNAFDKLYPPRRHVCSAKPRAHRGRHLVAARCRNDAVRKKFQFVFDRYQEVIDRHKTGDLMDSSRRKGTSPAAHTIEKRRSQHPEDRPQVLSTACSTRRRRPPALGSGSMDSSSRRPKMSRCARRRLRVHFFPTASNVIGQSDAA